MINRLSPLSDDADLNIAAWKVGLLKRDELDPTQAAALWRAGFLRAEDIGQLASRWLETGQDQGSAMLASLALNPPASFAAGGPSFETALAEIGVAFPTFAESVLATLEFYLRIMIECRVPAMTAMNAINDLYYDRGDASLAHPHTRSDDHKDYMGRELGLEHLYTWYRELQDAEVGSTLFYYNDLPRDQQLAKFQEELIAEARILHDHLCLTHPELRTSAQV